MTVTLKYMMKETFVSPIFFLIITFTRATEKQTRAGLLQIFLASIFASFPEIEFLDCSFKLWLVVLISYSDT